ncbi:40S ribosomal protein S5-1 [Hordeum vulgare]|nr:40S ribosomal protein S5-1 [Hordeum vulgare]
MAPGIAGVGWNRPAAAPLLQIEAMLLAPLGREEEEIFKKVINPYLAGVLQHPQSIKMREGMLHIRDVEGPKKTGNVEARLEAVEQRVFKCQGLVEHGLNANHMMITEFTNKHKIDTNDIGKHLSRLYDRIDHLQT